jgi:phage-related protein
MPFAPVGRQLQSSRPDYKLSHELTQYAVCAPAAGWTQSLFCDTINSMRWTFETLNALVDEEIISLPPDMQARLLRLGRLIQEVGFEALPRDSVKHLEDRLWELRVTGRDGISRAIYVTAAVRRVVVLRVFVKKTQKIPARELKLARQRAKEVK